MPLDRHLGSVWPLFWAFFSLGFYVALLPVVIVIGDGEFSALFPLPWRMLLCVPAAVATVSYWLEIGRG